MISNVADALSKIVGWVINFAPLGIMGLVFDAICNKWLEAFVSYGKLLAVLVGSMAVLALIINPLIVYMY